MAAAASMLTAVHLSFFFTYCWPVFVLKLQFFRMFDFECLSCSYIGQLMRCKISVTATCCVECKISHCVIMLLFTCGYLSDVTPCSSTSGCKQV